MKPAITPEVERLVHELHEKGITLERVGETLRCRPRSAVTDDLLPRLREHKPVLLAILDGPGDL